MRKFYGPLLCHPNKPHYAKGLCINCYHVMKYKENPNKYREYRKKHHKPGKKKKPCIITPEQALMWRVKHRAKERGLEFNLGYDDIIIPTYCPVLGIKLIPNKIRLSNNSPSLDRIDNSKGYIKGNVIVVSDRVNRIKSDASIEELKKITDFYSTLTVNR